MNLRAFIKQALVDIVGGVQDAQSATSPGTIVPDIRSSFQAIEAGVSKIQTVEFEVAVQADETKGSEAKINVMTAIIGGGVQGKSGSAEGHTAKLKFNVPIRLPVHH